MLLVQINRAACCSARLRYASPGSCNSRTVDLGNNGGLRWRFVPVQAGVFRLNAVVRYSGISSSIT